MKYLSFVFFKEYFYFIAYWIISFINSLINHYFQKQIKNDENANKKEYNAIYLLCYIIGDLLGGFLVLYTYFTSKSEKEESKEKKNECKNNLHYELIFNDLSVKKYKYRLILTISILHFIALSSDLLFYLIFVEKTLAIEEIEWLISIELLARIIFCRFILKIRLYKHHILSIIISMTGFLFMGITGLVKISKCNAIENRGIFILFTIITEILISLEDVLCNILLIEKFMLPHILMFFRGIIDFIIFIILIPILNASGAISLKNYLSFSTKCNISLFIFLKILLIIFAFIKGFITMKVIYIFNPLHVAFLDIVFSLYEFIEYMISPDDNNSVTVLPDIFDIFFLIIIIIGTLIFNEMIIIKAFGLDEETKKGLLKKEQCEENNERNDSVSTTNEYNLQERMNNQNEDNEDNCQN